jgi:hypothetical protein
MSDWNHNVVFICPIAQQEVAKRISRSLDPDVGGYEAFQTLASADGTEPATHAIYGTPARDSFLQTVQALTAQDVSVATRAGMLKATLDADYVARWPEFTPPTLAKCEAFLADVQVFVDMPWDEALSQSGLAIIQQAL